MKIRSIITFVIALLVVAGSAYKIFSQPNPDFSPSSETEEVATEPQDRILLYEIESGETFGYIAEQVGLTPAQTAQLLDAAADVYDLATIRVGRVLEFHFNHDTDEFIKLVYEPNVEQILTIEKIKKVSAAIVTESEEATDEAVEETSEFFATLEDIEYEVREKNISGTIEDSLYVSALEAGFDERAIIDLAEMFAWQIDFAVDIRTGDAFSMVYEELYRDGEYIMPGQILAAKFENNGVTYEGFYYVEDEENEGYFDREGLSLQKVFLKSPIQYRYISSRFGSRLDPITRKPSTHTGIDYAAPYGTPAVSVGDGTVVRSGWNGGYGYSVDVRHNETYTTRYGHFSKLAVSAGEKVKQGDIVGYVGSTGWSTGPHLHYEMITFGRQVDPFSIDIPAGKALREESMDAYKEYISQFAL